MAYFNPNLHPIDYVTFTQRGGRPQRTPGLARVLDADQNLVWDQQMGYGLSGAVLIFKGAKLVEFSVELRLHTDQDWIDWENFRGIVQRPPYGKRPAALAVAHPWLVMQGVKQCVSKGPKMPVEDGTGMWTISIPMCEYRTLTLTLSKPEATPVEPLDPYDQKLKQNQQTIESQNEQLAGKPG